MRAARPKLNPQSIARRGNGTILFYWLGEKQSYLWAITRQQTRLFTLPPGREIEASIKRYRAALSGPANVLESSTDGSELYRVLVAPVQSLLQKNSRVFVVPDGELNNLNFETLVAPSPAPHYWIEDVDVVNTSSLRILAASLHEREHTPRNLLLIGDSASPSADYPELSKAADQMATVERHFDRKHVYQRELATPSAYLDSNPEQFSYIHFVAHGTASRLAPLDSAIVLSKEPANPDSFKLYAREITQHKIRAELVTISACYSAGDRHYSGEGMVGLAWAFLRAGSRNVVAALWEVTDVSTDQLMDRFYEDLSKGASPDVALRAAKLTLLRGERFRSPFYWAPLQLFRG
jgi:CHAT domain-containing protein